MGDALTADEHGIVHVDVSMGPGMAGRVFFLVRSEPNSFVLQAEADETASKRVTLPAEQFDELAASLDVPDDAPALEQLAQRRRRYHRV